VAERLRLAVERELNETAMAPRVTISIGISTHGFDGGTPQQLLVAADRALYIAKQTGRNRVVAAGLSSLEKTG
jgi:diguanylate cyclase (GGDEF)-like protein